KGIAIVLHDQWRHQDLAKEIAEHPLGAGLGTINADDAEVLRSHLLHARMDDPAGLVQDVGATSPTSLTGTCRRHVDMPPEEKLGITQFSRMAVQTDFFSLKPTYQGSGVFSLDAAALPGSQTASPRRATAGRPVGRNQGKRSGVRNQGSGVRRPARRRKSIKNAVAASLPLTIPMH